MFSRVAPASSRRTTKLLSLLSSSAAASSSSSSSFSSLAFCRILSSFRAESSSVQPRWSPRRHYRRGPHSATKTTVGGYRPPLLDDDEPHPYDFDDFDDDFDDEKSDGSSKKFFKLRRRQVWENDVRARVDDKPSSKQTTSDDDEDGLILKSEKRGGRAYRPERNKNRYRRAMEKQAFIRENNGERRRNLAKKRAEESKKVEEKWRSMSRFAQRPDLLTLEQCESCKKTYAKHEGECKKCAEKNDEESVFSM